MSPGINLKNVNVLNKLQCLKKKKIFFLNISHFNFALLKKWLPIYRLEDEGSVIISVVSSFAHSCFMLFLFLEGYCILIYYFPRFENNVCLFVFFCYFLKIPFQ